MLKNCLSLFALVLITATATAQNTFPTPTIKSVDLQSVDLSERIGRGKATVVAVWATWCQPCHMELDHMKSYLDKWRGEYGVEVLAISVDKPNMVKRIAPLVSRKGWDYEVLVDSGGQLQRALGFRSIPQMYVIDGDGKIVKEYQGYASGREHEVDKFLAKLTSK